MANTSPKDFTVAIVGGGMCGLSCAYSLIEAGINVRIFERTAKFDDIGAAIGLGPNAVRVLDKLGLLEPVLKSINIEDATTQTSLQFVKGTGNHEILYDLPGENPADKTKLEKTGFGIYRPTFIDVLASLIDPKYVSFLKRLTEVTSLESGQYRLIFSDDTTYDADVVIGADGIKSTVRDAVLGGPDKDRVAFSNRYIYRDRIFIETLKGLGVEGDVFTRLQAWAGLGKQMITFPVKDHTVLSITATVNTGTLGAPPSPALSTPWVEAVEQQELLDAFKDDWGKDALAIFGLMTEPKRWALHTIYPPLETYVKDKLVIIGDAAHGMVPFIGAGAGQGFEDVYALWRFLTDPKVTKSNLSVALAAYDNYRRPLANVTLEQSLTAANNLESLAPLGGDEETLKRIKLMYEDEWIHNLWHHDFEQEVSDAIESF